MPTDASFPYCFNGAATVGRAMMNARHAPGVSSIHCMMSITNLNSSRAI